VLIGAKFEFESDLDSILWIQILITGPDLNMQKMLDPAGSGSTSLRLLIPAEIFELIARVLIKLVLIV
jgi:hypothetical protein